MAFNQIRPDFVRYEMRMVQGEEPFAVHQKRPGGFGRFLSGLGKVLGAIAAPFSFIFPPAMIGALTMYGLGSIGDRIQAAAYNKQMKNEMLRQASQVVIPGMEDGGALTLTGGAFPAEDVLNVLYARNDMMMESVEKMK